MQEIIPGVHHWTTHHDPISARVSSYLVEPAGIVIDPKVPDGGLDALPARPHQVVLTSGHHARDAQVFADELGIPVRASREAAEHLDGALDVATFGDGDDVAPGVSEPLVGDGKSTLREFVQHPVGEEAYGQSL